MCRCQDECRERGGVVQAATVRRVPALPTIDHAGRRVAVAEWLAESDAIDALLVTDLTDVRWLTGFGGSHGWAVLRGDALVVGTDGRYGDRARAETSGADADVVAETSRDRLHERLLGSLEGATRVALDAAGIAHATWTALASDLPLLAVDDHPVKRFRQRKDPAEVARIEAAAAAADAALAEVEPLILGAVGTPVTESEIRNELEYRMRRNGADDRSYATIVASGPENAARPHHEVGGRTLKTGDTVIVDVGALVDGYHSDMTRSYVVGPASSEQFELYELVATSQTAGLAAVEPGATARHVDDACRSVFEAAGVADRFIHGTGHGVGLEIHESPFLGPTSDATIAEGNVVTVEPGLYRGGFGGFRIEDLVVVTDGGHRPVTHTPKRRLQS
jgi:Xaa-Pro aminopeptidase